PAAAPPGGAQHQHVEGAECVGHPHQHEAGEECHGHHHHEEGEECCGHHHSHEGHHHHADEVFTSWGIETPASYTQDEITRCLEELEQEEKYGIVLRAKGMVPAGDGTWVYFDYVPGERDIRSGKPDVTGKICVIGSKLHEENLAVLFRK
ncbi:MAG: cobalamin biosynthesis protein CobW, partial [Lachnospiraceae bacterium]|nr:cobalamin biosynthesis protein CobW [Lachnospiraceae bacterium]